eukprot:1237810-Lingulodinium_polyedra.AAC.1
MCTTKWIPEVGNATYAMRIAECEMSLRRRMRHETCYMNYGAMDYATWTMERWTMKRWTMKRWTMNR